MPLPANTANVFSRSFLESLESDFRTALLEILPDLNQDMIADVFSGIAAYVSSQSGGAESDDQSDLVNSLTDLLTAPQVSANPALSDFQQKAVSLGANLGLSDTFNGIGLIRQLLAAVPFVTPGEAAAFTTVTATGQLVSNGNPQIPNQLKWTQLNTKANGKTSTAVTFAFADSFAIPGLETGRAKTLFASALQTWADYAPLDFFEIENPGLGNAVDIWAQSASIDGPGSTLAFAYFPSIGDITFDLGESWTEPLFLETAVHELGHSLGLAHEDGTEAIMNSVLANRFVGADRPFLLTDDINGIRSLYGAGLGSVKTLAMPLLAPNLVVNGSFEDVPIGPGESAVYKPIKGWSVLSGLGIQVDKRTELLGAAAEGVAWATLDVYGQNSTIGQNIDTVTGQTYRLSGSYRGRGQLLNTADIQVFWEGQQVDVLTGGGLDEWLRFDYEVKGGDRTVSTLAFRAVGPVDSIGGFIDNISVTAKASPLTLAEVDSLGAGATQSLPDDLGSASAFTTEPSSSDPTASPFPTVSSFV